MPINIAESTTNLAGSDLDKKVRAANESQEEAWIGCGKTKGIEIFRIEKCQVKAWPKDQYGTFYDGDCYIILHTQGEGVYDVHYLICKNTTQDEASVAAIKTIELDDFLGGKPIQHREVQDNESGAFLNIFNHNIRYLSSGIESGFAKGQELKRPNRLLHFRSTGGIKNTKMFQRNCEADSLNEDDVFILDAGAELFIFQGTTASPGERMLASSTANRISTNRAHGCHISVCTSADAPAKFWELLGGKIKVKAQPDPDKMEGKSKSLYKISDASGKIEITTMLENQEQIPKTTLKSEDAFIIDTHAELIVWVGSATSAAERMNAMPRAQQFLNEKKRPANTPVTRVLEGAEGAFFKECVSD